MLIDVLDNLPDIEDGKNICIALSGGLDSTTLVHALVAKYGKDSVKAISFDFGQRHTIELAMAKRTARALGIELETIKLDYLADIARTTSSLIAGSELKPKTAEENAGDPQVNTYVPFRNLQFAAITASYAEAKNCRYIAQGLNAVDAYGYWDTSVQFTESVNAVLRLNRQDEIQFIAPFVEMHKDEELRLAKEISCVAGYDILENTWSCYNGFSADYNFKECGKCNTCEEKLTGYILADYPDDLILNKFDISRVELQEKIELIKG